MGHAEGRAAAADAAGTWPTATIAAACSAVSTIGTITPIAPTSSTRAMKWYSVAGTRTIGTRLRLRDVAISMRIVSTLQPVCSMSKIDELGPGLGGDPGDARRGELEDHRAQRHRRRRASV